MSSNPGHSFSANQGQADNTGQPVANSQNTQVTSSGHGFAPSQGHPLQSSLPLPRTAPNSHPTQGENTGQSVENTRNMQNMQVNNTGQDFVPSQGHFLQSNPPPLRTAPNGRPTQGENTGQRVANSQNMQNMQVNNPGLSLDANQDQMMRSNPVAPATFGRHATQFNSSGNNVAYNQGMQFTSVPSLQPSPVFAAPPQKKRAGTAGKPVSNDQSQSFRPIAPAPFKYRADNQINDARYGSIHGQGSHFNTATRLPPPSAAYPQHQQAQNTAPGLLNLQEVESSTIQQPQKVAAEAVRHGQEMGRDTSNDRPILRGYGNNGRHSTQLNAVEEMFVETDNTVGLNTSDNDGDNGATGGQDAQTNTTLRTAQWVVTQDTCPASDRSLRILDAQRISAQINHPQYGMHNGQGSQAYHPGVSAYVTAGGQGMGGGNGGYGVNNPQGMQANNFESVGHGRKRMRFDDDANVPANASKFFDTNEAALHKQTVLQAMHTAIKNGLDEAVDGRDIDFNNERAKVNSWIHSIKAGNANIDDMERDLARSGVARDLGRTTHNKKTKEQILLECMETLARIL